MSPKDAAELIKEAAKDLEAAGIADAKHDARRLLHAALSDTKDSSVPIDFRLISSAEFLRFRDFVVRRAAREPLQHITQTASIFNLTLKSDHRALIPRFDSAEVIILAMRRFDQRRHEPLQIADLGTGSGVLLAEALDQLKSATGFAVERNPEALSLAVENFTELGLIDRVQTFSGSWADWQDWGACDLILSNPPYIRSHVIPVLEPEVRDHEPLDALDGGQDGLDAYREIISLGAKKMKSGADLILEIGFDQKEAVSKLLIDAGFEALQFQQDMGERDRAIAATKS